MPRTQRVVLFDGSSGDSSNDTSTAVFVGDATGAIMGSWVTDVAVASRLTYEVSDDEGFDAVITEASWESYHGTSFAAGPSWMSVGPRWMRVQRNSNESLSIVVLTFQNDLL